MPREFIDLSPRAQNAIVDAFLGVYDTDLPPNVKDEIRDWATPPSDEVKTERENGSTCKADRQAAWPRETMQRVSVREGHTKLQGYEKRE